MSSSSLAASGPSSTERLAEEPFFPWGACASRVVKPCATAFLLRLGRCRFALHRAAVPAERRCARALRAVSQGALAREDILRLAGPGLHGLVLQGAPVRKRQLPRLRRIHLID